MSEHSPPSPEPSPARVQLRLSPLLWSVFGLSLLWTAMASMDWWGAPHEQRWITSLTLQSLSQGDGWTVNGFDLALATSSPLLPLLGLALSALFPAAPMALWALSTLGIGMFAISALSMRWTESPPAEWAIGIWAVVVWGTHPLVLSSLGEGWLLGIGILILGAAMVESGRGLLGWLLIGASVLARAEMAFGLVAIAVWALIHRERGVSWKQLAVFVAPVAWSIFSLKTFGHILPTSWTMAFSMSQACEPADQLWSTVVDQSPIWVVCFGVLIVASVLKIRSWGSFAWAAVAVGVGSAAVHASLDLPTGQWWWLNLGPLFGTVILAATGLSWFLSMSRPLPVRVGAAVVALVILLAQWLSFPGPAAIEHRRGENQTWQQVGQWVRENTAPRDQIATTSPGSLIWHTGVIHRLAVRRVSGLIGPLAPSPDLLEAINAEQDNTQALIDGIGAFSPSPDILVFQRGADDELIDAVVASGDWELRHTVEGQSGLTIDIFNRRSAEAQP